MDTGSKIAVYPQLSNEVIQNALKDTKLKMRICSYCSKSSYNKLNQCSSCKTVYYCDINCQRSDWPNHKTKCVELKNHGALIKKLDEHALKIFNKSYLHEYTTDVVGVIIDIFDTKKFLGPSDIKELEDGVYTMEYFYSLDKFVEEFGYVEQNGGIKSDLKIWADVFKDLGVHYTPVIFNSVDLRHYCLTQISKADK